MVTRSHCPDCGCELPADSPAGLCPDCLLKAGLGSRASDPAASAGSPFAQTTPQPGGLVPPEPAALAPHFPQLEILELLGHGGMGAVYKARQTKLDRMVALKIVRPESAEDAAFTERFNREARTLARLNHPNIVAVHDFGEVTVASPGGGAEKSRTLYYFLMEYVDGANLRRLIDAHGLTPLQALEIVPKICDALQFAHDEGVVHRDIKPENILIDSKGRVKIADFGLAKLAGRSAEEFTLTGTHQVMGTPRYMAPEQMEGSHAVDHRADIYSLGVVFYEMLTGQVPAGHFEPPSKKVQIDVRLDEVVLRSLAREPARRYQQASQVKSDVEVISGSGVHATARAAASSAVAEGGARAHSPSRSTLGRAWDAWWGERDKWFTTVVQTVLVIAFFACMICYLSFNFSSQAGPEFNGKKFRHTTVTYGAPTPWFHLETFPEPTTPWRSNFNLFSSSVGLMLLGFVAYGTYWQIEKAKPNANLHWSSSPNAMFVAWAVLTVFAVLWGLHPIVLDGMEAWKAAGAAPSPGKEPVGVPAAAQEFFQAVTDGQIESVAKLLANQSKSSALVNAKDAQGRTPLMAAATAGDPRVAAFLMLRGADEAVRDAEGRSALMLAVEAGKPNVVQMLVDMRKAAWDEDIQFRLRRIDRETTKDLDFSSLRFEGGEEWQDDNGETALMKAAARGDAEAYEALGSWSDKMARDKQGRTALVHAIEKRQIEFLKPLFDTADNYVKAREPGHGFVGSVFPELLGLTDGAGRTPLQIADATIAARIRGYLEGVIDSSTRRIAAGGRSMGFEFRTRGQAHAGLGETDEARADFREADRLEGPAASPSHIAATALLEACRAGEIGRVKALLDTGTGVNEKSAVGRTPLMNAVAGGHHSLALTLILLGADPTEQDDRGMTALLIAVARRDDLFLNRLRDLSQIVAKTSGPERKAQLRAYAGAERSLLEGRDFDLQGLDFSELICQADTNGETASLKAARQGDWDIVGLVGNHVDSLRARDKEGRTLAMHAAIQGHREWFDRLSRAPWFGVAGVINVFVGNALSLDVDQLALRDKSGNTALQLAEQHGHKEIARTLRAHLEEIIKNQTALMDKGGNDAEVHAQLIDLARQALGDGTKAADNAE